MNIKRLIFILVLCIVLVGCTEKAKIVKNPDGKSLAYNYFKDISFDRYTLKLKNGKRNILYIKDKDKSYYETSDENETLITIEKDNVSYTLDTINKVYVKENISEYTDYMLGYFPLDKDKFKNLEYTTGHERIDLFNYTYETYNYSNNAATYYFKGKKLKYIKNKNALNETMVKFVSISSKVDKSKFDIPKDYQELEV